MEYVLLKMDANIQIEWVKQYGGNQSDPCFGMAINSDGFIYLTGHTLSGTANWDTYTLKIFSEGSKIGEATTGNPRGFDPSFVHDEAWGVATTPDGGCIVVAGTGDEYASYRACQNNSCSDQWHVYLIKYNSSGDIEWQNTYSDNNGGDWAGEDIVYTSDHKIMVAVDDGSFGFLSLISQ